MGAVCIQEFPGDIDDFLSSPFQHQAGRFRNHGNGNCLKVFLRRITKESRNTFRAHHYRHSLLRFRDGKLRAVQSRVFLRHLIKVHYQTVGKFADCHRHAACAEVVALLNQPAYFPSAEKSLYLTLRGRVPFLHLRSAGFNGAFRMYLGGTGCASAAVPPCPSAQQNNHIIRVGIFPDNVPSGSGAHNRANLHALCNIIGVINFLYIAGCKSHLVSVGGITAGRASDQLLLGQLSL